MSTVKVTFDGHGVRFMPQAMNVDAWNMSNGRLTISLFLTIGTK